MVTARRSVSKGGVRRGVGRSHGSADDAGGDRHRHQLLEEELAGIGDVDLGYLRTRTERKKLVPDSALVILELNTQRVPKFFTPSFPPFLLLWSPLASSQVEKCKKVMPGPRWEPTGWQTSHPTHVKR